MTKNGDTPKCSFCNGTEWKKIINHKATEKKDTNMNRCNKCGSVADLSMKKEDILHKLYMDNPKQEPLHEDIMGEKK